MELMEGGNLADRLVKGRHVPADEVAAWLDDLSAALDYAHQQGIVHSGLKPTPIVFDGNGGVYVTDFAIASRPGDTRTQAFLGAPDFLAPEQWEGADARAATDQYALAVLSYLALTGSRPYEGQQDPEVRRRNYERGPVPAHEQAARAGVETLPASVSEVLKRALSVTPEERYPSVREFFLAFQFALAHPAGRRAGTPRVFVSYHRNLSAGWAVLFARELKDKHNISAFVDTQRVDSAVRVPAKIRQAIQDADIFVCLLAKNTLRSTWVQEEVRIAWESGKPMIPVFQESFDAPASSDQLAPHIQTLMSYEAVHLLDRRNIHVDHTIAELARLVTESTRRASGSGHAG
jgi:serine/threonine protein kinase